MRATAKKSVLGEILAMRQQHLAEMNCQLRYNACHERGWTDSWLLFANDQLAGYGSIKGREIKDRDSVFEFFVLEPYRKYSRELFCELINESRVPFVECQSNDRVLTNLLLEFSSSVSADVVLFEDHVATKLQFPGGAVRPRRDGESVFEHHAEPNGDYVLDVGGEIIATGGFMLHYNKPFADLYMEVREDRRKQGAGSFLLQEVKKACYNAGRIPAARTGISNLASRATLIKAGLRQCGFMLAGSLDRLR
jgi:GNAT superfamily N-acetyltransferase